MVRKNYFIYAFVLIGAGLCSMDPEIARTIEAHKYEVLWRLHNQYNRKSTAQFNWLAPHYIIKNAGYSREKGAKILHDCVTAENLSLIKIPQIWCLSILDNERSYDCCLSEYVQGTHEGALTAAQMSQCITLIKKAKHPYCDWKPENIVYMSDGRIALPDTEQRGFYEFSPGDATDRLWGSLQNLSKNIVRTGDAQQILTSEMATLEAKLGPRTTCDDGERIF